MQGMKYIYDMMAKFEAKHQLHISVYGDDNQQRLTGRHETSSYDNFSFGIADRAASVRIPSSTANANGEGYIEDRRPASNIDPYVVGSLIADTAILKVSQFGELQAHFSAW